MFGPSSYMVASSARIGSIDRTNDVNNHSNGATTSMTNTPNNEARPQRNKRYADTKSRFFAPYSSRSSSSSSYNNKRSAAARKHQCQVTSPTYPASHFHPTLPSNMSNLTCTSSTSHASAIPPQAAIYETTITAENPLQWMQLACPQDVLPKILAFCGPQITLTLKNTNTFWYAMMQDESTWRILCEEMYKWNDGDDLPESWKELYRLSPCVPTDYSTIQAALEVASNHDEGTVHHPSNINPRVMEQRRSIRILLRPGDYYLKEAIVIQAVGANTVVTLETMVLPTTTQPAVATPRECVVASLSAIEAPLTETTAPPQTTTIALSPARRITSKIRRALSCRSTFAVDATSTTPHHEEEEVHPTTTMARANLISKTRRQNEPILRVRQGTVRLNNLGIVHNSHGMDIWNGNAAIQVQPPMLDENNNNNAAAMTAMLETRPTAELYRCDVTSRSGRGICTIDGGTSNLTSCWIHDCAATGVYVGGPGSRATMISTDVVQNGNGNHRRGRHGIARGHSGIYLEQGRALIRNCNIYANSLTGISAVSQDNAILTLEESDLIANGTTQLEMPPDGSLARRSSLTRDNLVATVGLMRSRSGLIE